MTKRDPRLNAEPDNSNSSCNNTNSGNQFDYNKPLLDSQAKSPDNQTKRINVRTSSINKHEKPYLLAPELKSFNQYNNNTTRHNSLRNNNFNLRPWTPTVHNTYAFPPFYSEKNNGTNNSQSVIVNSSKTVQSDGDFLSKGLPPRLGPVHTQYNNQHKIHASNAQFNYHLPFPLADSNISLHTQSNSNASNYNNGSSTTGSSSDSASGGSGSIMTSKNEKIYSNDQQQSYYAQNNQQQDSFAFSDNIYMNNKYIFRCNVCGKYFKRKSWLKRHLLSHSSNRQYSCPWCLSKHKRKDNLLQHMKLKHKQQVLQEMDKLSESSLELNDESSTGTDTASPIVNETALSMLNDDSGSSSNDNVSIIAMVDNGTLKKENVKKVLNSIIERQRQ
ncbi:hypothetical protein TPHA_0G03510 [Tetrapisispora phaffii CBS 4417]|uniref:C2H2-type domain-containing protein n=1 Tax=Tetrapisispora phaffii (strain ATCC 24235 / CBS 4417 / NBRC 1672 / NRRL Y-8282 / UCD 70-5) TaxID=1071381 RepID=G8BWB3_TETPH|nr:hypothetical protein TPHA_0G03510 [Tetrapisispora phaffii CBS 4417]CCE64191.1 hypothetical protein TPHA_0G03510 [Tetrapisispora phaffii CBS 4417]